MLQDHSKFMTRHTDNRDAAATYKELNMTGDERIVREWWARLRRRFSKRRSGAVAKSDRSDIDELQGQVSTVCRCYSQGYQAGLEGRQG